MGIIQTIVDYFESRYSKAERECVQSVVIDLNAQYQSFIYRISGVPIVETLENRKLVGIITNRDTHYS